MYKIFLKNISELINKRVEYGPVVANNYLAAVLKSRRLELNLTLHETTENICSEAFLSKVERNLMDPRNDKVELLCERLNLDYYTLVNLETNDRVEKMLGYFFLEEYKQILSIPDRVAEDVIVAQDDLIKAYKAFVNEDYKELHFAVLALDTIKECLSDAELFALVLLVFEFYFKSLQYQKASLYLNYLEGFTYRLLSAVAYVKERRFILSCKMNLAEAKFLFPELRKDFYLYSISKQFAFVLYYNETQADLACKSYLEALGKDYIPANYLAEYHYAYALCLTRLKQYQNAMDYLRENAEDTLRFSTLFAYNLRFYCEENVDEGKKYRAVLINMLKSSKQSPLDTYHIAFLRLMQYEIDKTQPEIICNYIKNQLLKELKEFSYPLYDEYIHDRYCYLLGKLCRYKDAYCFLLANKKTLKK